MSFDDAMHTHTLVPLLADRSGYIGVHTTPLPYWLPAPPRIPRLLQSSTKKFRNFPQQLLVPLRNQPPLTSCSHATESQEFWN